MKNEIYIAVVKEDGTYGDPVKLADVKEIAPITASVPIAEEQESVYNFNPVEEVTFTFTPNDPYKFYKELAWAILNLKRSSKHLISKNMIKE